MKRSYTQREAPIHIDMVRWLRLVLPRGWRVHHSPNGGKRNIIEAARLKRMGVLPGFPDIMVMGPLASVWFIEVKAEKGGLSAAQHQCHDDFKDLAFPVFTARSIDELRDVAKRVGWPVREVSYGPAQREADRPGTGPKGRANPRRAGALGRRRAGRDDMPGLSLLVEDEQVDIRRSDGCGVQHDPAVDDDSAPSTFSTHGIVL
jgi:hypothetical protein